MKLEAEDGTRIPMERCSKTEVGRGPELGVGPSASDRTVSRRHLSLRLLSPAGDDFGGDFRVSFEVTGKNPILVCRSGGRDKRVYRSSEKGELRAGDRFSLSLNNPSFFVLTRREGRGEAAELEKRVLDAVERRERRTVERRMEKEMRATAEAPGGEGNEEDTNGGLELVLASLDVSQIDPVREFGFLARGHEFDNFPKQKIRPIGDWNWFLEDPGGEDSDADELSNEATCSRGKVSRRKKKGGRGSDDENWSEESGEEKVSVAKFGSSKRPGYSTRSKDAKKRRSDASGGRHPALLKDVKARKGEVIEEDKEDETLGAFIVDDEEEEGGGGGEEEEEEALEEDLEEDEEDDEEEE